MTSDLSKLDPAEQDEVRKQAYLEACRLILDSLMESADLSTIGSQSLYDVYRAVCIGQWANMHQTLARCKEDEGFVDPEVNQEILRRMRLTDSLDTPEAQKAEMERCKADLKHFINNWCWGSEPRSLKLKTRPFVLWPRQVELVDWMLERYQRREKAVISKSRDTGVSMIASFFTLWLWLFYPGSQVGMSSYRMDYVWLKGDKKALFTKLWDTFDGLPPWMRPERFKGVQHYKRCSMINPDNGSNVTGEVGSDIGRGARASVYFCDEFSKVDEQQAAFTSLSGTTDCVFFFGTAVPGSHMGELQKVLPTFYFPWTDDPRKPSNFKEIKLAGGMTEVQFELEFNCNAEGALEGNVIKPHWIDAAQKIQLSEGPVAIAGLDPAGEGGDESSVVIRRGPVVEMPVTWSHTAVRETTNRAVGIANKAMVDYLYYDRSGLGYQVDNYLSKMSLDYPTHGIDCQNPAETIIVGDDQKLAVEIYQGIDTQLWFELASRLEKTYYHFHGEESYRDSELISLPDDPKLREQLLSRTWHYTGTGLLKLDPKKHLSVSPDRADALVMTMSTHLQREEHRKPAKIKVHTGINKKLNSIPW